MNVLFMTSWYPSVEAPGDYPFVREHARAAAAAGHDIRVLVIPDPDERPGDAHGATPVEDRQVTADLPTWSARARRSRLPMLGYARSIRLAVRSAMDLTRTWRPDIVHSHSLDAAMPARTVARRLGTPHVHTVHWSGYVTGDLTAAQRVKTAVGVWGADRVLPVSQFLAEAPLLQRCRRVTVVPNAIDVDHFHRARPGDQAPRPRSALWVGPWRDIKQPGLAVAAAALLASGDPEFRLRVVGTDRPADVDDVPHIEWLGRVPHGAMPGLLADSGVLWSTSRLETFGLVVLEAIAVGLPVVVTPVGALPEIVTEGTGRFARTAEDFAAVTREVLDGGWNPDPEAVGRVTQAHSLREVGSQLTRAYRSRLA